MLLILAHIPMIRHETFLGPGETLAGARGTPLAMVDLNPAVTSLTDLDARSATSLNRAILQKNLTSRTPCLNI